LAPPQIDKWRRLTFLPCIEINDVNNFAKFHRGPYCR
jgi:hypothetical protein